MIRLNRAIGLMLLSLSLSLSLWSGHPARAALTLSATSRAHVSLEKGLVQSNEKYKEYAFYHEDGTWVRNWFQCDRTGSVAIMMDASESRPQHYLTFDKSHPAQQNVTVLDLKQDADCGMQKCWWTFNSKAPGESRIYAVEESHYYEPGDGYWTSNHKIGTGASEESAVSHAQPCRWFLRTRAAVITERRSLYITETKTGRLVLRVYDYQRASNQPALFLTGGESRTNMAGDIETFVFKNRGFAYFINIGTGESTSLAEVFVMKRDTVLERDNCLSYTYLKKS
jgi:hypothetical protein